MKRFLIGVIGAATLAVSVAPRQARAAASPPCTAATMTPAAATIPVNFAGFAFTATKATSDAVHLVMNGTTADVPVTLGPVVDGYLKVAPTAPLTVGASYRLTFETFCGYGPVPTQAPIDFTVTAAAPIPSTLGAMTGQPAIKVEDFGTSKITVSAVYSLAPEMKAWAADYRFGLLLNGRVLATHAQISPAADSVTISAIGWCDAPDATKSSHELVLRARLPFASTVQTPTTTATFSCPAPNVVAPPHNGLVGQLNRAAGPTGSELPSGGAAAAPTPSAPPSSGGCAAGGHPSGTAASALLIASAMLLAASSRRRAVHQARARSEGEV